MNISELGIKLQEQQYINNEIYIEIQKLKTTFETTLYSELINPTKKIDTFYPISTDSKLIRGNSIPKAKLIKFNSDQKTRTFSIVEKFNEFNKEKTIKTPGMTISKDINKG